MTIATLINKHGTISNVIGNRAFNIATDHPNYTRILDAVRNSDWNTFVALADIATTVRAFIGKGRVQLVNGQVTYNGEILHNSITNRVLDLMNKNLPFSPLLKFLDNLMQNPSKRAVDELYGFLEVGNLPITEDGHFLAFKNVKADWYSSHGNTAIKPLKGKVNACGQIFNGIGEEIEITRNQVCEDKNKTCSDGLHFCSQDYLQHFSCGSGTHTVILKINPADVVSIPADYKDTKGRCYRYVVVAELNGKPADLTNRAVVGDFDPKKPAKDGLDGTGANPPFSAEYNRGYAAGEKDAELEIYQLDSSDSKEYALGYNAAQDDYDVNNQDDDEDYGIKPSGQKFYNVHGAGGRFVKKS